jgi:hypothetical protein
MAAEFVKFLKLILLFEICCLKVVIVLCKSNSINLLPFWIKIFINKL